MQPEQPNQPEQPEQPVQSDPAEQWQQPTPTSAEPHAYHGPVDTSTPLQNETPIVEAEAELAADREPLAGEEEAVRWQATEYIQRDKDMRWYIIFAVVTAALVALAIFLIRSWTFAVLIPVMAAAIVVMAKRPPMVHSYTLSRKGLHIDDQLHSYNEFREFGLVVDDDQHSIMLIPRKRLRPGVTVYFPEEAGEAIVDTLAARLPMKQIKLDPLDKLVRFLRI